jgi:tetratricopeptide (TPR) repeat protein
VHFNLGLAYVHKQDYDRAREEFHRDIALEPDVPFAYEQLGSLEATVANEDAAAKNYRSALKLDPQRISSLMGLAKIEEHRRQYAAALSELDQVIRLDSGNASARYLRGQVLMRMGRKKEGREEYAAATKIMNQQRETRHEEPEGATVPSPELAREPE